jgi:hypothetical protein
LGGGKLNKENIMKTKYAILNPMTGTYSYADDEETALSQMQNLALGFYLSHTHNSPISVITVNANGDESWAAYTNPIDMNIY